MPGSWAMARRRTSGPRLACCTTSTLSGGRNSTARKRRSFCGKRAAALMRPSKSCQDMEVKSLKKKYKDKKFAAGCSRDVIQQGADRLGWTLEELMEKTILAMRSCEDAVNAAMETL